MKNVTDAMKKEAVCAVGGTMKKTRKQIMALVLTAGLLNGAAVCPGQDAKEEVQQAYQERDALKKQLEEVDRLLNELTDSKKTLEGTVGELDQMGSRVEYAISQRQEKIEGQQKKIDQIQSKLKAAQTREAEEYENMKKHICFMYENGGSRSYINLLLRSDGMTDFLNRAQYISQIMEYDSQVVSAYQKSVKKIEQLKKTLDEDKKELVALQEEQQQQQQGMEKLNAKKQEELHVVEGSITDAQALAEYYEAELRAQEAVLAQINRQTASGRFVGAQLSSAGLIWPCPAGNRVSSDYGPRTAPTAGASTFHRGIDIPASQGADILAAADGMVSYVGYEENGGGNYCIVNHGTISTVYMHASAICVQPGQEVIQGEVIAKVGSTGIATGPHLHFAISVDGEYVNPWTYLQTE